jgi:sugar transferase EpsL
MAIVGMMVRIFLGSPIFFFQARGGFGGSAFKLYKFRSMTNETGEGGFLLPDEQRLTRFSRFLRSSSLDELPSLLNVLRGDMSIVGPRPFLADYLSLYTTRQARRHEMRPGITGWAQVNGRNAISWEEKFELDIWYIEHWSLLLDFKILLKTLTRVFRAEGISQANHVTARKFRGTPQ